MKYLMYEIKNNINGKIYVGVHKTKVGDDGYMGSGKVIKRAIAKHGIENFTKTILERFDSLEAMFAREKEVVNEEFLARDDTYNILRGGQGGFDHINKNNMSVQNFNDIQVRQKAVETNKSNRSGFCHDPLLRVKAHLVIKEQRKGVYDSEVRKKAVEASMTNAAKIKRKLKFKENKHSQGEKNSQFGSMWITNGIENRKVGKESLMPDGWSKGRFTKPS